MNWNNKICHRQRVTVENKTYSFRCRWELNFACYLQLLVDVGEIKDWLYEPDLFWFSGIKRGVRSYLPDFKIINNDDSVEYIEIKGYEDNRSKTKHKRMAIYYPDIKFRVIYGPEFKQLMRIHQDDLLMYGYQVMAEVPHAHLL